jgi:hypothetical protein
VSDVASVVSIDDRPHILYRMYDGNDALLYVGITARVEMRFGEHRKARPWWPSVATVRLEHFPDRNSVLDAEAAAIGAENPRFNVRRGTGGPHRNFGVHDGPWRAFGEAVGERKRSAWLSDFIDWVVADGQVWRDAAVIAKRRNELLGAVVLTALRRYVARNRHLLDDSEDE